jgi:hypothetical protein
MPFFRFLVISLMTSASIAPLTAQTKQQIEQLPIGCGYMRVPVLESPFPRPALFPEESFFKDRINLTRVVAPSQFLLHSFPSSAKSLLSPMPALFPDEPSDFIMVVWSSPSECSGAALLLLKRPKLRNNV